MIRVKPSALFLICIFAAALQTGCLEKSEVRFSIAGDGQSGITPAVRVSFFDGFRHEAVVLDSLHHSAGPFSTQPSGRLRMLYSVLSAGGVPVNEGSLSIELKDDWRWGIDFHFSANNPVETCFGCSGYQSLELDPSLGLGGDVLLFIVWGGNSISDPVIY